MNETITIEVRGMIPAPQGSKRHVGNGVMVESCKTVKPWSIAVAEAAVQAGAYPLKGAVTFDAEFIFPRPRSHYRTGKKSDQLKPNAPYLHSVKPDVSKLQRSTEDALSGIAFQDDARIAQSSLTKRYADEGELPGAVITIANAVDAPPLVKTLVPFDCPGLVSIGQALNRHG